MDCVSFLRAISRGFKVVAPALSNASQQKLRFHNVWLQRTTPKPAAQFTQFLSKVLSKNGYFAPQVFSLFLNDGTTTQRLAWTVA
jgi:hypothetical protein